MELLPTFRDHHKQLLKIAGEIDPYLVENLIENNAFEIRKRLTEMMGLLKVHLAMEDNSMYPKLMKHPNTKIQETAKQFYQEMGGISEALINYHTKWPFPEKIKENPKNFITETYAIFEALKKRIKKEDIELYPLLEELKET